MLLQEDLHGMRQQMLVRHALPVLPNAIRHVGCRVAAPDPEARTIVDEGNAEAQVMLGGAYRDGLEGLEKNLQRGFLLHALAAAQGQAEAQTRLGCCYSTGEVVEVDHKTAALWFQRDVEQDHAEAQWCFGAVFYGGKGVTQSYDEAVR